MNVRSLSRRGRGKGKKAHKTLYTAEKLAQLTGLSARTFRRAFTAGEIANSVTPAAGGGGMPARTAAWAAVASWCRKRGMEVK